MLKQSFIPENFRRIFDYENRKGANLEGDFFPVVSAISQDVKACNQELRALRKQKASLSDEEYHKERQKLRDKRNVLKQKRDAALSQELEKLSVQISDKGFRVKLKEVQLASGKTAYSIGDDPASYFAIKQIQYSFRKLYKVKQSNRYDIVRQLTNVLDNDFPKYIIRTDIYSFYESIPRAAVLAKINKDPLLTHLTKKIIRHILTEYGRMSGKDQGIPRGVGISAYLAELHMRSFDEAIRRHQEVVYYARYVDDIVVVFFPKSETDTYAYLDFIKKEALKDEMGLELNDGEGGRDNKTWRIDLASPAEQEMEYLGYSFVFGAAESPPKLHLSSKKIERYKNRIDLAFEQHAFQRRNNKKAADRLLVKRIAFLTGNTRLVGNKRQALVGIYYSNSVLSGDSDSLTKLDVHLSNKVNALTEGWLKERLIQMGFRRGFERRTFKRFSTNELAEIVRAWKHEA